MANRRVVVTGLGLVTPLGVGKRRVWEALKAGQTGVTSLKASSKFHHVFEQLPCKVAAFVPEGLLDISNPSKRTMSMATSYALVAAQEALEDADWQPSNDADLDGTGVSVGMGMSPFEDIFSVGNALQSASTAGYSKISPHFVPRILTNMAAGQISIRYAFRGPNHSVATACATGAHAIGDAFRFIKHGDCDVMVCGGTEASIDPLSIAGFCRMRALSTRSVPPAQSSRPFDSLRDGFVMGEGAGILVLEELRHALDRKASNIYGEVLGYGMSGDGHHVTAPRTDGRGAFLCMRAALSEARTSPEQVGYINAHATSTPLGDAIEIRAISDLFSRSFTSVSISSTKGATGHLLGAAGAVEAIFSILACLDDVIPPTVNLHSTDCEIASNLHDGLKLVDSESCAKFETNSQSAGVRVALTNSFGFGGTNACLCVSNFCH